MYMASYEAGAWLRFNWFSLSVLFFLSLVYIMSSIDAKCCRGRSSYVPLLRILPYYLSPPPYHGNVRTAMLSLFPITVTMFKL